MAAKQGFERQNILFEKRNRMNEKRIVVIGILACAVLACEMVIYFWYISSLYSLQFLPVNISVSQIMSAVSDTEETQLNKSTRLNVTSLYPGEVMVSTSIADNHKIISSRSSHGSFPNITGEQSTSSPVQKLEKNFSLTLPMIQSYITQHIWPVYNWTGTDVKSLPSKTIMFHNIPSWLQANGNEYFKNCEVSACSWTSDTKWRQSADAIFYHVPRLKEVGPPEGRPPGQIWIAFSLESPFHHSSEYRNPGWKNVFNWTITYRQDSDLFHPYSMLKIRDGPPTKNFTQVALEKTKSIAWFVSNCDTPSKREVYVKRMQQVISVDIFGECGSQQCGDTCNDLLNKSYRFYLSFENSLCRDYVTEKLLKIYADINVVPVVRGGADYKKSFPPGTFIDASDFKGPEDLAAYLKNLEKDIEAYSTFLRKKDEYRASSMGVWCKLCEMLHFEKKVKWYLDFPVWLNDGICKDPSDLKMGLMIRNDSHLKLTNHS